MLRTVGQNPHPHPPHAHTQQKKARGNAFGWDSQHQASSLHKYVDGTLNLIAEIVVVLPCWAALDSVCTVH